MAALVCDHPSTSASSPIHGIGAAEASSPASASSASQPAASSATDPSLPMTGSATGIGARSSMRTERFGARTSKPRPVAGVQRAARPMASAVERDGVQIDEGARAAARAREQPHVHEPEKRRLPGGEIERGEARRQPQLDARAALTELVRDRPCGDREVETVVCRPPRVQLDRLDELDENDPPGVHIRAGAFDWSSARRLVGDEVPESREDLRNRRRVVAHEPAPVLPDRPQRIP